MVELTQQQVIEYNKKVMAAKEKAANDKARKEFAEKELLRLCAELSEQLGHEVTPDNLEAEYELFKTEAIKTIESGEKILEGLEREASEALTQTNHNPADVAESVPQNKATSELNVEKPAAALDLDELMGL